jgi:hypothetical protein
MALKASPGAESAGVHQAKSTQAKSTRLPTLKGYPDFSVKSG